MEMGSLQVGSELPDTLGLPEFFISSVVTEIDGPNVRMICGVKRGGHIDWLFSCVMRADQLIEASKQCADAAKQAVNLNGSLLNRTH